MVGHDFGEEFYNKLSFYFGLKDEFEELGKVQDSFSAGLAKISAKIRNYEALLEADLQNASGPPPVGKKASAEPASSPSRTGPAIMEKTRGTSPLTTGTTSSPGSLQAEQRRKETSDLEIRLGQKWLLIVGLLTMVFGVGYFLKYSFDQGWVGPAGRVAMAYVWGIVFLIAGVAGGDLPQVVFEAVVQGNVTAPLARFTAPRLTAGLMRRRLRTKR